MFRCPQKTLSVLRPLAATVGIFVLSLLWTPLASAQPNAGRAIAEAAKWPTEQIELSDGRFLSGLIESETAKELVFVELQRPQGKPMYLVVRHLSRDWVKSVRRLDGEGRKELRSRIDRFRNWSRIEAGRMENVALDTMDQGGVTYQTYQGPWFSFSSTAEEETSRRSIVRIEQVFMAYQRIFPPRYTAEKPMTISIFGSTEEYRAFLRKNSLEIENPSFYASDRNLVVAGSDLKRYVRQLAKVRARHASVQRDYQQFAASLPELLARLSKDLKEQGVSQEERNKILAGTRNNWEAELAESERQIKLAERANDALFDDVTARMFTGLAHEAFHAYLENFVYPRDKYHVPRWLNEGLAQIFEGGQLEDDTLRLDAPPPKLLAQLQADLKGSEPLGLAQLLSADESSFLVVHPAGVDVSSRHYLYSWGLAYYLTFLQPLPGADSLDKYVDLNAKDSPPLTRFENLSGMPLPEFERRWRKEMLGLRATAVVKPATSER